MASDTISIRVPEDLGEQLRAAIEASGKGLTPFVVDILRKHFDAPEASARSGSGDSADIIALLRHIIYELVRTRVSLFSIAEKLVDAESLELIYREACPVAQRYVARLSEEMGRAERGEPRR